MTPETTTIPCAICLVTPPLIDGDPNVPYGANVFTSTGHYGATAYDPVFGGEHLRLIICTGCLLKMQGEAAVQRILHTTHDAPVRTVIWGSDEDTLAGNPWNEQRLRNEAAMTGFLDSTDAMTEEWALRVFNACTEASRDGRVFNPTEVLPHA